ncbi:MAG TPA: cupin domain-containing protein [Streptosporangiaceae bacterium]|nr:cupin domain-containing protein [Streptosporangiaceae bacterium]
MTLGVVVRAADVDADRTAAGASVRKLIDTASDDSGLVRRLVDLPSRSRFDGTAGAAGELWFVIDGAGQLDVAGEPGLPLSRDRGLWMPPGAAYQVRAGEDGDLRLDIVSLPAVPSRSETSGGETSGSAVTGNQAPERGALASRDLADCEIETTGDRQFRVVFGPGRGCAVATQFVGEIPPGRAPDHSHPYDEVVLILQGEGIAHIGGAEHPLSAGTCAHLPPRLVHCLENTGSAMMRVLGVFHPADSPAAKLEQQD